MIRLIMDTMGGDRSPGANVEGSLQALEKYPELYIIFSGDQAAIEKCIADYGFTDTSRYEILHAPDVITGEDKPTDAIRLKRESSMMKAIKLLRESEDITGMISTGATGALVAAATVRIGRIRGLSRPAFCPILPTLNGGIVGVCDSGANVDCTPEQLLQFSVIGKLYLQSYFGIEQPRIALLNIGTETEKGDVLHKEVFKLLQDEHGSGFVGNMEGRDLLTGKYDLVVSDGFSGNILVKTTEGTAMEMLKMLKRDIYSKGIYKFGALFMKSMFQKEKDLLNYQNYGGSVLLGTEKIIVKGHGSSGATSVLRCIEQALAMEKSNLNAKISEYISGMHEAAGEKEDN